MRMPRASVALVLVLALVIVAGCALSSRGSGQTAARSSTTGETEVARLAPIVYVPPQLPASRVALVIALHGSDSTPRGMESITGFDRLARADGFIVAYLGSGSPRDNWILPSETSYISSMIDRLEASEPVDPARVYVTGFSAGGYESYRSGCLLSDKVAAIAPVGVTMNSKLYATCKLSRPVSTLITIGSADTPHYGGYRGLPSAPAAAARWRALDGCPPEAPSSSRAPGPTTQESWSGCADGSAVGLNTVVGGVHTWPGPRLGSSRPDGRYEASAAIWAFFAAHRAGSAQRPDARLSSLRAKLAGHTREVVLTLRVGEPLTIDATLSRNRRVLASARRALTRGSAVDVVLPVARGNGGGRYSVGLVVRDTYGRMLKLAQTVLLAP